MSSEDLPTETMTPPQTMTLPSAEFFVVEGPNTGASLRVPVGTSRVGTAVGCALRLTDPKVSRVHCEVSQSVDGLRLVDAGSTNGTYIDGVRVYDALLLSGATIRIGETAVRVEFGELPEYVVLSQHSRFGSVLGGSAEMRRIYAVLERVAGADTTVLIQGETGTGKELVARSIHDASRRSDAPFITVDCGAFAATLIESELFGHMRGAFSGAVSDRIGLFEEAGGGTVFLDEIGELPLSLQPKLLRVLEAREVRRIGSNVARKVDVRLLAATNRPLSRSVNEGSFREDLYYRLAVVEIEVPPLRARRDDILTLGAHFYAHYAGPDAVLPRDLVPTMLAREWPGNVRELRNFVERFVSLGFPARRPGPSVSPLAPAFDALVPIHLPLKDARVAWTEQFERLYVTALLKKTQGNVTRAAEVAGINRRWLQRMIAALGIRSEP